MRFGPVWPLQTPTPTPTETATEVATDIGGLLPFDIPMWVVNIGESLIVVGLAIVVSRLLVRLLGRRVAQQFRRPSLTRTALRGIRASVYIFALLTILNIYGLRLTDIGLSVAIFSAVVGVVLAPILGSYISGMFLLADQPYEIGDMIELADTGQRGFVEDITLRHTKMFTLDNTFLVIPNGEIRQRDVINYSAEDSRTRLSLDVLVTYESDIAAARTLIEAAAREVDNVISGGPDIRVGAARYPASPTVYINNFADHGVLLTLRYWVTEPYKLLAARSRVQTNVWRRLEDANVEIAYPHSHLYFDDTSGEMNVSLNDGLSGLNNGGRSHTATGDSPVPPRQDPDDLADE
ncbi:mechanosensitive ion channel family protein [Haloarcula sp. KBTZ06]|uniref:Mechanosensitive ion channel family protein n=1 Tax=Haloarcula hispanica TaxID=51589 RepID=A0A5J5LJC6_HALHI|nr:MULTISPECIES: mechanosensitive ion channel family protein [Haloarcula]AJF26573.1 mechanosensitive ion channel protein MscS [Haloarcula sp. CBA1115]KAA9407603.1 mechanosensitive ion channel family protein [Haloarcula sp. CBA1131]KAA9409356.1 mechanosensitive ion channel family protein [Haloarcula hispanica]MUV49632.1 mechanosensitive ion channel [Haloarcula sp. CBA1122]